MKLFNPISFYYFEIESIEAIVPIEIPNPSFVPELSDIQAEGSSEPVIIKTLIRTKSGYEACLPMHPSEFIFKLEKFSKTLLASYEVENSKN